MDINTIVLAFFIYSFLGWCTEVVYQYFKHKVFINRGFLNEIFCPIYGFCALLIITCLSDVHLNFIWLFILTSVLTSVCEYATSFFLEKFFSLKWWDYTEDPFNLHGRICFHFSLAWGLASVFLVKVLNPFIISSIGDITSNVLGFLAIIVVTYLSLDFCVTLYTLIMEKINGRRKAFLGNTDDFDYTNK